MEGDTVERSLVALRRITRAIDLHSRQLLNLFALTGPQVVVLREIGRFDQIRIGDLASRVSLSNATTTGIVDRLERAGFVSRIRSLRDRRQVLLTLTESGNRLLEAAPPLLQDRFVQEMRNLPPDEQWRIVQVLDRVSQMMGAANLDVAPYLANNLLPPQEVALTECPPTESTAGEVCDVPVQVSYP